MKKQTNNDSIQDFIRETVAGVLGVDDSEILPNANLVHDLEGDSLDVYEIIFAVEDKFDLDLNEINLAEINSVQNLFDLFIGSNQLNVG